jgi:hypothetical protein
VLEEKLIRQVLNENERSKDYLKPFIELDFADEKNTS